jgi:hypothetical protein
MKTRTILAAVIALAAFSITAFGQTNSMHKGATKFKVRIENISSADGFTASNGMKWPFAISPGAYSIHRGSGNPLFRVGTYAGNTGLEAQAEDGNPEMLVAVASNHAGVVTNGTFKLPVGASTPGPVTPGTAFEFEVMATPGAHLFITFMFGQSNDLFFGNENGLELFDKTGKPLSGDVTSQFGLWDAGTEVNEELGIGPNQAPRQKQANTGVTERKKVGPVKDGFTYPNTADVLRITVTPVSDNAM